MRDSETKVEYPANNVARPKQKTARTPIPDGRVAELRRALLDWYRSHKRDLPWRSAGDPYAVWVSEMMLQQTQVATVIPFYERWMHRFPSVKALAVAEEADVLHAWQGLGYYSRARNLLLGARAVVEQHGGQVPREVAALRELPGIGPYSAGAIASIAYGARTPLVDGNVVRVLCRIFGLRGDPARTQLQKSLWQIAGELVPEGHAADFNQSLMELGATVCRKRNPGCPECPVAQLCEARAQGVVDQLPETKKRPPVTRVAMVAVVLGRDDEVLVTQLPSDAPRWAGMWCFPGDELEPEEAPSAGAMRAARELMGVRTSTPIPLIEIKHSVTRYRITLSAFRCEPRSEITDAPGRRWTPVRNLDGLALPRAHQRIAQALRDAAKRS